MDEKNYSIEIDTMAFQFKLKGYLKLKEFEEEEAQMALGVLNQKLYQMELNLKKIKNENKIWSSKYTSEGKLTANTQILELIEQYIIALEYQDKQQCRNIEAIKIQIEEAQRVVIKAHQAKKQIERLKEIHKEKYDHEMKKMERKEIDELNQLQFVRRKNNLDLIDLEER